MNVLPKIRPVILSGGSGTRLWPVSRKAQPKPFLPLVGGRTLFEQALARVSDHEQFSAPIVVVGAEHVPWVEQQGSNADGLQIVVEPSARNTAPAIAAAVALMDPDEVMLVCPSDHHIADQAAFRKAAADAARLAAHDWMVSFAIEPDYPETGYGYIKRGDPLEVGFKIDSFVEKPDAGLAEAYLADGSYSWNGGIFAFRAGALLIELEEHRPAMARSVIAAVEQGQHEGSRFYPSAAQFECIEGESVDYAVMENTSRAAMVQARMGWSDIGNWAALHDVLASEPGGNVAAPRSDLIDCMNVLTVSDGPRISVVGLNDACVIVDGDEVLVTTREYAQQVGKLPGASSQ